MVLVRVPLGESSLRLSTDTRVSVPEITFPILCNVIQLLILQLYTCVKVYFKASYYGENMLGSKHF